MPRVQPSAKEWYKINSPSTALTLSYQALLPEEEYTGNKIVPQEECM